VTRAVGGTPALVPRLMCMGALTTPVYRSSNGDAWFLEQEPSGALFVVHRPNEASGGRQSRITVDEFFGPGANGPEQQALTKILEKLKQERAEEQKSMDAVSKDCPL
jgi:hypothetical protein